MNARLQKIVRRIDRRKGELEQLQRLIESTQGAIRSDSRQSQRLDLALAIVKHVGLLTQKQLEYHLAEQVSLAMDAVFDDPYKLKVEFEEKRGQTEVQLLFVRRDLEFPPIGSAGGGAIDIAAFALRIAYWSMRQDKKVRPIILLDEPFSHLKGEDANRRALAIVQEIAHRLDLQIIMVSDERVSRADILANADRVFEVVARNGISKVTTL